MSKVSKRPFLTERTRLWRSRDVKPAVQSALDIIEEHGYQKMHVAGNDVCPAFSYTAGVFETFGKPELITVGLPARTADYALDQAVAALRKGVDLAAARHRGIINNEVEAEFRTVDSKWLHQVMLRADWFYDGEDVPVLQLVFPDLDNRFQDEDDSFNEFFRQPFLSGEIEEGTVAYDFWESHNESSSLSRWKFSDEPHVGAYLSTTVNEGKVPVTYVSHDADGDWQFLGDDMAESGAVLSCLHHPIDRDSSLEELHDLPQGWYATRADVNAVWERFEHPAEETEDSENGEAPLLN